MDLHEHDMNPWSVEATPTLGITLVGPNIFKILGKVRSLCVLWQKMLKAVQRKCQVSGIQDRPWCLAKCKYGPTALPYLHYPCIRCSHCPRCPTGPTAPTTPLCPLPLPPPPKSPPPMAPTAPTPHPPLPLFPPLHSQELPQEEVAGLWDGVSQKPLPANSTPAKVSNSCGSRCSLSEKA